MYNEFTADSDRRSIQNAVDELMALAGTDGQEELTEMLCEFAENRMNEGKSFMVERELSQLAEELFKEQSEEFLESLRHLDTSQFLDIQHRLIAANRQYEHQMRDLGNLGLDIIASEQLSVEDFYYGTKGAEANAARSPVMRSRGQNPVSRRYTNVSFNFTTPKACSTTLAVCSSRTSIP